MSKAFIRAVRSALVVLLVVLGERSRAGTVITSNEGIIINQSGSATPYPAVLSASGLPGVISNVKVTLQGFSHSFPDDVDILLVSPSGQKVVLMSDAGGGTPAVGATLTFDSTALIPIPDETVQSGIFQPADYYEQVSDLFTIAPAGSYAASLQAFNGASPNGPWRLYIVDDFEGDGGSLSGWSLDISTEETASGANSFVADFSSGVPPGVKVTEAAEVLAGIGLEGSAGLRLTSAAPNERGALFVDSPSGAVAVSSFSASFQLYIGGGSQGDGFSFSFGADLPQGGIGSQGAGSGVVVQFNSSPGKAGISAQVGGVTVAQAGDTGFRAGRFVPVVIGMSARGELSINVDGQPLIANVQTGYAPIVGIFALAASTSAAFDRHIIDDLLIQTTGGSAPQPPVLTCPADKLLACGESSDPSVTGTATAQSLCAGGAPIVVYSDVPPVKNGNFQLFTRTWTATDACGSATCTQNIRREIAPVPTITLSEISYYNETLKKYTISADQPFSEVTWSFLGTSLFAEPGLSANSNSITINFAEFRGGAFLNSSVQLSVDVQTPCEHASSTLLSAIGNLPLISLTKGAAAIPLEGHSLPNALAIESDCGTMGAGSASFRFKPTESGMMRFEWASPGIQLLALRLASVLPLEIVACTNSLGDGEFDLPVEGGEIVYIIAADGSGGAAFTARLTPPAFDPPLISGSSDLLMLENTTQEFPFAVSDSYTAAADLVLAVTSFTPDLLPATGISVRNDAGIVRLTLTPSADRDGVGSLGLKVTNAEGLSTTNAIRVTVQNVPHESALAWPAPAAITYGTPLSSLQLNATSAVKGVFTYEPPLGTILLPGEAQELAVTFTPADSLNYSPASARVVISVRKALLTIRGNDQTKIYGEPNPLLTVSYTGFVAGQNLTAVSGAPSISTTALQESAVDEYPIYVTAGTLSSQNYDFVFVSGTLTVDPAPLIVSVENARKLYGAVDPVFTARFNGLVNGDTMLAIAGNPILNRDPGEAAGQYVLRVAPGTLSAANYQLESFSNAVFTIDPAPITAKAENATKTYGDPDPVLTVSFSGLQRGDTATVIKGTPQLIRLPGSGAGTYLIHPSIGSLNASNYRFTNFMDGILTIKKAAVTITALDASRPAAEPNPPLSGTIVGLVSGDTLPVSYETTADLNSLPGTYPITPKLDSSASLGNYEVTTVPGTLLVTGGRAILPAFQLPQIVANALQLALSGNEGEVYLVQTAESLINPQWRTVTLVTIRGGVATLSDPAFRSRRLSFYRAVRQ